MKITGLKTFLVNLGGRVDWGTGHNKNWFFVKIYTDEGIDGLGEVFHSLDEPAVGALKKFERWLIGKDPTRIIHNWQAIYRGLRYPLGTATLSALSAVEQALWDISGKACGLPVYKMLGGPIRDRIRVYASATVMQGHDHQGQNLAKSAQKVAEAGFTALKITPQPPDYVSLSPQAVLAGSVARVKAVREAVGEAVDICLDYHGRSFSPIEAIRLARALEPYHIFFLEEPALTENPDSLVEAKAKTTIPIAAGERCVTRSCMRELISKQAVHIIQPEPLANGGILETIKVAAMAEMYHIMVAPHQASSPVSLAVCAQIDAVIPNFLIQECNVDLESSLARDVLNYLPQIEDGYLRLPDRPGLGIELNEDATKDYPGKPYDRPVIIGQDGAIGLE
jgi:galactonate dehydratase